nr:Putative antitoxin VapB45 [uncultured bacterium]
MLGRPYPTATETKTFAPLIRPAQKQPVSLSFMNLVEAHVLRALRTEHGVSVDALRRALRYAEAEMEIDRLLLRQDLLTHAGGVLLKRYGQLIDLSASGQLAMQRVLEQHLKRVEWAPDKLPVRLYPFVSADGVTPGRDVAIDPNVAFGRPILRRAGVSTGVIAARLDAGESVESLAEDYDLTAAEIEQAAVYERAA